MTQTAAPAWPRDLVGATLRGVERLAPISEFLVEVQYREPTYELHAGAKTAPYSWRYRISAGDEDEARRGALGQFYALAALSSVGWVREVVGVTVQRNPVGRVPSA